MRDLICDVINYYASSFAKGKLSVCDQIVIKHLRKKRNAYQTNFYMNFHVKDDLRMEFTV